MGHARTYISIDILRRVLKDYFKFDVHFVMNITDIDDKIIKRARQRHFFDQYLNDHKTSSTANGVALRADINHSRQFIKTKHDRETDSDKKAMYLREMKRIDELLAVDKNGGEIIGRLDEIRDPLSDWLDCGRGKYVTDNSIFEDLPRMYEREFLEDLKNLNVLPADRLTRVSESIKQIVEFTERIIKNGFAYEADGSVYFDTDKFDKSDKFFYAKLCPTAFAGESFMALLKEGEGVLMQQETAGDRPGDSGKRNEADFALWKKSKAGEPSWDSPWGKGRPGWHIECSAMAADTCGDRLDIHTGGVDLKFPHHDNEIAQSEAALDTHQWVNYFLHTGHLTISGCKMSKSLKNFISIREALQNHSARQLRLLFLLQSWKDTLDYSDETMTEALGYEKLVIDFFYTISHTVRYHDHNDNRELVEDVDLKNSFDSTRDKVHQALSDSINTREAMFALRNLISSTINYHKKFGIKKSNPNQLKSIVNYVYDMLHMFGAADDCSDKCELIAYTEQELGSTKTGAIKAAKEFIENIEKINESGEEVIQGMINKFIEDCQLGFNIDVRSSPVLQQCSRGTINKFLMSLANLRQSIRAESLKNRWFVFLKECDRLRDSRLSEIGVRLQDSEENIPIVGLVPLLTQNKKEKDKKKQRKR